MTSLENIALGIEADTKKFLLENAYATIKILSPLKPILEITSSKEDCKKVFEFISGSEYNDHRHFKSDTDEYLQLTGFDSYNKPSHVFLYKNGSVMLQHGRSDEDAGNIFAIVDFIRSLGYDAK